MDILDDFKDKLSKLERDFIASASIATGLGAASILASKIFYDNFFKATKRPDYKIYPGLFNYELIKDKYPRKELRFPSNNEMLVGYYYESKKPKGLVVVCHGMRSGADDYIPAIIYFLKNHYNVFAFNYKGVYESSGQNSVGMSESLVDLDNALNFLENTDPYKNQKICLFGHSWGAFAVTSVLNIHKNIKAVAAIGGFNDASTILKEKKNQYTKDLIPTPISEAFLDFYQKHLFKDYVKYNATNGINSVNIPILLAHGIEDKVIDYYNQSITSHKDEFINHKVIFYDGIESHSGHDNIWHSKEANIYRENLTKSFKELQANMNYDEKVDFYSNVDYELYSDINYDLFNKIIKIFDKECKKKFFFF